MDQLRIAVVKSPFTRIVYFQVLQILILSEASPTINLKGHPEDKASSVLLQRVLVFRHHPPPKDWDSIFRLKKT